MRASIHAGLLLFQEHDRRSASVSVEPVYLYFQIDIIDGQSLFEKILITLYFHVAARFRNIEKPSSVTPTELTYPLSCERHSSMVLFQ
jgi:hypothetical protein